MQYPKITREVREDYLEYIRKKACLIGVGCTGPVHPHHVQTRGSGGSDFTCIPLCSKHHVAYHNCGKKNFEDMHHVEVWHEAFKLLLDFFKGRDTCEWVNIN
jgi:hypothetical protein